MSKYLTDGMKTSEFWGKVIVQVIGLAVLFGVVAPETAASPQTAMLIQVVAGLLAVVIPELAYAISRGLAKQNPNVGTKP